MTDRSSEFLRPPPWRTRTTPAKRRVAAVATLIGIVIVGGALLIVVMWLLDRIDAPTWVVVLPWLLPTLALIGWAIVDGDPAKPTDDTDDSWPGFVVRWTFAGERHAAQERSPSRPVPVRVIIAALIGAPIAWAYLLFGIAALVGLD